MNSNIIAFPQPPKPASFLEELITEAQDLANTALCGAADQIQAIKFSAAFERQGDAAKAGKLRAMIARNAAQVIEDLLASRLSLCKVQNATLFLLNLIGEETSERRTAVAGWAADQPALDLITLCKEIAVSLDLPPAADLTINVELPAGVLEACGLRINAQEHGADLATLDEAVRISEVGLSEAA